MDSSSWFSLKNGFPVEEQHVSPSEEVHRKQVASACRWCDYTQKWQLPWRCVVWAVQVLVASTWRSIWFSMDLWWFAKFSPEINRSRNQKNSEGRTDVEKCALFYSWQLTVLTKEGVLVIISSSPPPTVPTVAGCELNSNLSSSGLSFYTSAFSDCTNEITSSIIIMSPLIVLLSDSHIIY